MKVLITGAEGQVAFELLRFADRNRFNVIALSKKQLDIVDLVKVKQVIYQERPDILINTAAYTKVDQAEENSDIAHAVNEKGVAYLAKTCELLQIPIIHFSTDYVFDGAQKIPYQESDSISPLNKYGLSKWAGEQAIRENCSKHIILRVSAVFGVHGVNFVKTMLRLSREKDVLQIVSDQVTCPTPASAIAKTVWGLCDAITINPSWGTYHYCGQDSVSWYDFANHILDLYTEKLTKQVIAITSSDYPMRAQRPLFSVLDCSLLEKTFGIKPADWKQGLQDVVNELSAT